ncbi:MAG TPA: zinc-ribbon domain-containing protein [Aridibacter sp.]|nr:zinc-ribbon domain-containing protein [Aridibacter sp.]
MYIYCPKCGTENTSGVRFCRKCGAEIEAVAALLEGRLVVSDGDEGKGIFRKLRWELAMLSLFLGVAFLLVAFIGGIDGNTGTPNPLFALLIFAFPLIGFGIAQAIRVSSGDKKVVRASAAPREIPRTERDQLPESRTDYVSPEPAPGKRNDDLVAEGVVEKTTRRLELGKRRKRTSWRIAKTHKIGPFSAVPC